jgi:hypothetical protein
MKIAGYRKDTKRYQRNLIMYLKTLITLRIKRLIFLIVFDLDHDSSHTFDY